MAGEMTLLEPRINEHGAEIAELQAELRSVRSELSHAKAEAAQTRRDTARALSALRQQLTPLFRALQIVFGELDAVSVEESSTSQPNSNPRTSAIWASWKSKFPGKPAMIIDALLLHGEMNTSQIAIAIGSSRGNVPPMISKLNKAGLLNKNGKMFSLKQL